MTFSIRDRWQQFVYLNNVDFWLDGTTPRWRRDQMRELKSSLRAAAATVGTKQAIADLGSARTLANEFAASDPKDSPTWSTGILLAISTFIAWNIIIVIYGAGVLAGLSATNNTGSTETSFLGFPLQATYTESEIGLGFSLAPSALVVPALIFLVIFLLGSRVWRLIPRRTAKAATTNP